VCASSLRLLALAGGMCALLIVACAPSATRPPQPGRAEAPAKPTTERRQSRAEPASGVRSEMFLDGLQLPAALTFAPDGRLFFVEVNAGRVRVASGSSLQEQPVATLPVQKASESGLLGLALDPAFTSNHYVYLYYSEADPGRPERGLRNRVVRFVEREGEAVDFTPILDDLPINEVGAMDAHQGGALIFGSDGKLYVTTGDTAHPELAQDWGSPVGKILRINPDGSVPSGNPVPGSRVYAMGLRNPWGLTVHPRTGQIYLSENGNKSHDEIELLRPGANYGWPFVEGSSVDPRFVNPVWDSGDAADSRNGMTGLVIYDGPMFPEYEGSLLFCAFRTGKLRRVVLGGAELDQIVSQERLQPECRLGITAGPDGAIYTANIDKILRLTR